MTDSKVCNSCKTTCLIIDFSKDKSRKDGLSPRCKKCHTEMNLKYKGKYNERNKLKARIKYNQNKIELNAKARQRHIENPEINRLYKKQWRLKNREQEIARQKRWRDANPDKVRISSRMYKNKRKGAKTGVYTTQQVLDTYGTDCHLCGKQIDLTAPRHTAELGWENGLHLDHLIRINDGGADCLENVRPSHGLCNLQKH